MLDGEIPRELKTSIQTEEVDFVPQSEVSTDGMPNLATQEKRKALTKNSAVLELNGATSGQLVVLSIMVRRYRKPWLEGRGSTRSR